MCRNTLVSPFTMTRFQALALDAAVSRDMDRYERDLKRFPPDASERDDIRKALDELGDLRGSLVGLLLGRSASTLAALSVAGLLADSAIEEASTAAATGGAASERSFLAGADHV